nr:hypothetical protein BAR15_120432 [Bartonella sp. AR 15-3]
MLIALPKTSITILSSLFYLKKKDLIQNTIVFSILKITLQ